MTLVSITTFNANNLFLRYDFQRSYPGGAYDSLARIDAGERRLGYLPGLAFGGDDRYEVWDDQRRRVAAQALREPDDQLPDVLCLQEVENIHALRVFNAGYLGGHYGYALLVDGYDPRNIDVGILSRFPIVHARTHVDQLDAHGRRVFSRDCLEVTLRISASVLITLFVNHLKSKWVRRERGDSEADLQEKRRRAGETRRAQAWAVRRIVRRRFRASDEDAVYAVLGDFNDMPRSPWLSPLTHYSARLWDVVRRHRSENDSWTHYWRNERRVSQVDLILGSRGFARAVDAAIARDADLVPHVERGGLGYRRYNAAGDDILPARVELFLSEHDGRAPIEVPFRFPRYGAVLDDRKNRISDHCPVKVWLEV
jgi:endonuclease/exonuclease/phosphatase family metal-dependent hydrolase